jgi:hypothetical protein
VQKKYDISQPDLCCTECCTPSVQEPVRKIGQIEGHEVVHLCQECDALMDAQLREEFGVKS